MFKKRDYIILGTLVITIISIYCLVIAETKTTSTQVQQGTLINQIQVIQEHIRKGENDLAITLANRTLESDSTNIKVINLLAQAYINKNDLTNAEAVIKRAMTAKPDDPWSYKTLAHIYGMKAKTQKDPNIRNRDLSLALEQLEKGLSYSPDNIWLLGDAAQIYFEQGDKVKANQTIDKALSINPNDTNLARIKEAINTKVEKTIKK